MTHTINYQPIVNAGYPMWERYDGPQYQADMTTARALGFDCVRVAVPCTNGAFDYPQPTSAQLANLADFADRATAAGVRLHLSLFDWCGIYGQIGGCTRWAQAVLGAIPRTVLDCVELQNELPAGSTAAYTGGFDTGWPAGTPHATEVGDAARTWALHMIPVLRAAAPGLPVTVSTTGGTYNLAPLVAALDGTDAMPDWWEWHCYVDERQALTAIETVRAVTGHAPLRIGEFGAGSQATATRTAAEGAQVQSDYMQEVRWACGRLGLPEPAPWCLFDLAPSGPFPAGQEYGLLTTTGAPKLAASMYGRYPLGTPVPWPYGGSPPSPSHHSSPPSPAS